MTISEVSEQYDLSPDTLRYYERIGLIPPVRRKSSGVRDYSEEDCKWVGFIKCMRGAGLPIEQLIEYVDLFQQGEDTSDARKNILVEQRAHLVEKMEEIAESIARLDRKIAGYDNIKKKERNLRKDFSK